MLVDFTYMQTVRPVSSNNQTRFEQISQETEDYYLPKYLGRAFAYDVQANSGNYSDLLTGTTFEDCDGNTVKFKGLKYILAYFIFAEYISEIKFRDTYTGFVTKQREEANNTTAGQEEKLKARYRRQAESEVEVMIDYLNENYQVYPLWGYGKRQKGYSPKFTTIKRTGGRPLRSGEHYGGCQKPVD